MLKHIIFFLSTDLFFPPHWQFGNHPLWDWRWTVFKAFWAPRALGSKRPCATGRGGPSEEDGLWASQPLPFLPPPPTPLCSGLWEVASGSCHSEKQNANQTNNSFPRFAYRERDLFMKHILLSFRGKSCNHCKGKSVERALFCIKISLLYDLCGWDLGWGSWGLSVLPKEGKI